MATEERLYAELHAVQARMQELSFQHYRAHYQSVHRHNDVAQMLQGSALALSQLENIALALDAPAAATGPRPVTAHISLQTGQDTQAPLEEAMAVLDVPALMDSILKNAHAPALDDAFDLLRTLLPSVARLSCQDGDTEVLMRAVTSAVTEVLQHGASAESTNRAMLLRVQAFTDRVADIAEGTCQATVSNLCRAESALEVPDLQVASRTAALRGRLTRLHRAEAGETDSIGEIARSVVSECSGLGRGLRSDVATAGAIKAVGPVLAEALTHSPAQESLTKLQQTGYNSRRLARDGGVANPGLLYAQTSSKLCTVSESAEAAQFAEAFNAMRHVFPAQEKLWVMQTLLHKAEQAGAQNAQHMLEPLRQLVETYE